MDEVEFSKFHSSVKRGDIVGVTGFPGWMLKLLINSHYRFNSLYVDSEVIDLVSLIELRKYQNTLPVADHFIWIQEVIDFCLIDCA